MEIRKLFGREVTQNSTQALQKGSLNPYDAQAKRTENRSRDDDSVTISALSRQLAQLSTILTEDDQARQARVAELKERVQNGSYSADPEAVAGSLIAFAADTEQYGI